MEKNDFLTLYQMVLADGIVHPKELETIYNIGKNNIGLTDRQMNEYIQNAGAEVLQPELPEDKLTTLYRLAMVAWADGKLDKREKMLLKRYILLFGVNESRVDELSSILLDNAQKGTDLDVMLNLLEQKG